MNKIYCNKNSHTGLKVWSKLASLTAVAPLLLLLLMSLLMLQFLLLECGTEFDLIQFMLKNFNLTSIFLLFEIEREKRERVQMKTIPRHDSVIEFKKLKYDKLKQYATV